jgi:hypothetical protein
MRVLKATATHPAGNATVAATVTALSEVTARNEPTDQKVPLPVPKVERANPVPIADPVRTDLNAAIALIALIVDLVRNELKAKPVQNVLIAAPAQIALSAANDHPVEIVPTDQNATVTAADRVVKAARVASSRALATSLKVTASGSAKAATSVAVARIVTGSLLPSATGLSTV